MQSRDRSVAVSIFLVLLVFWLGFLVHRSPRFAGSAWGGFFGVTAALLMLVPLVYTLVKRIAPLRRQFTQRFSFRSLLQAHVYLGLIGALLALLHSGHKFQSALGIALTATMLLVVISGFIGQYFLRYVAEDIREKQVQLGGLWRTLEVKSRALASGPLETSVPVQAAAELIPVATATAELQYSLQFQERVRKLFNVWLNIHILCSVFFYLLLSLHVWAGIHFGLRWFE
jgi:hypothetical protein